MTKLVARQSKELLETLGYDAQVIPHPKEASMKLIINNKFVARVIEGCNSVSVIILFFSLIVVFAGKFTTTVYYILAGIVLIYYAYVILSVFFIVIVYMFIY